MYKVLHSMRRVADEIIKAYGLTVKKEVFAAECAFVRGVQAPHLILELEPNSHGWKYLSMRPLKTAGRDYSKNYNNSYAVMIPADAYAEREVIPSWRGHLVPWKELGKERYRYYIGAGYLPIKAGRDISEDYLIRNYERGRK